MSDLYQKNFAAIQQALRELQTKNADLTVRLGQAEASIARLNAELNNTRAMALHVMGRGTGPTTRD